MSDEAAAVNPNEPRRTRWLWAVVCALALAAAVGVAEILGWTQGVVGRGLLIASVLITLVIAIVGNHLPTATRRQVGVAGVMVVVIFAAVLGVSWIWGRSSPSIVSGELGPPTQRTVEDLDSDCDVPSTEQLVGQGSSRILSTRVAASAQKEGDFIAALVAELPSDPAGAEEVRLTLLECDGSSWRRALSEPVNLGGCDYELVATQLRNTDQEEVLFGTRCGSGAFLDFRLFGEDDTGSVQTLYSEDGIFQGEVSQLRDHLVVVSGRGRTELKWDGERLEPVGRASSLPAARGVIIEFWWDDDGGHTDVEDIPVRVNERVYFYWDRERNTDVSVKSHRILGSLPQCRPTTRPRCRAAFREDERGERYLVLLAPNLDVGITIIPNGYEHEQAIRVTVRS